MLAAIACERAKLFSKGRFEASMATLDVGARSGRRETNHELPLVPFIDFLLCIVAFLLVTAVWSDMARLEADANVASKHALEPPEKVQTLHVDLRGDNRVLVEWKEGTTLIDRVEVPREHARFVELAKAVGRLWGQRGGHRAASDIVRDRAVLHTSNQLAFEDVAAALDAIYETKRTVTYRGLTGTIPAFDVAFAAD